MAGEETQAGGEPGPDELQSKPVGQRFFIYSGGVLMNVLFALIVFPPLLFFGVPFPEPLIGGVVPGGPAWKAGLESGTRVLAVDGEPVFSYESLLSEIALSSKPDVQLLVLAPGSEAQTEVSVRPGYHERLGFKTLEILAAADPEHRIEVAGDSPAFAAGLRSGDRILKLDGSSEELQERLFRSVDRGEPLALEVQREGLTQEVALSPTIPKLNPKVARLGVVPVVARVRDLRAGEAVERLGLRVHDRLLEVNGYPILRDGDFELALRSAVDSPLELRVEREAIEQKLSAPALDAIAVAQVVRDVALVPDRDDSRIIAPESGAAWQAGVRSGDRIVRVGETPVSNWTEIVAATERQARAGESLAISITRRDSEGARAYLEFSLVPRDFVLPEYGFVFAGATYIYRASTPGEAVRIGMQSSWKFLTDSWHTLSGIFRGSVSGDNLGGIIAISQVSYAWAGMGLAKLLFFLCMLSLNLAFLNVLPIPVLDGGHLFFLLVEKVKGSPVNERVLGYSQMVGLVLILGLVVFVTYNDLRRLLE
jgi:regulator of sigma E protease